MVAGCIFLLAGAEGCAFSRVEVQPTIPATSPLSREAQQKSPGRGREVLVAIPFLDARDGTSCGTQKNGWSLRTVDAHCTVEAPTWFSEALAAELLRAGFDVIDPKSTPGPSTIVVQGTLSRFYIEPVDHFFTRDVEADLAFDLRVSSGSGLRAERRYYLKGTAVSFASTEGRFQRAADLLTEEAPRRMAKAIVALVDRYPGLGAPSATAAVEPIDVDGLVALEGGVR